MKPFEISRVYDAPRAKVWQAWTEPSRLKHWWGPRGFKVHTCKVDLRPGGVFLYGMKAPDGSDTWGKFAGFVFHNANVDMTRPALEFYYSDPGSTNPEDVITLLYIPIN